MCTVIDTRKGSGSVGTGPGRLGFVCDAGFGWQKQVGVSGTVFLVVVRSAGEGAGREEPRGG